MLHQARCGMAFVGGKTTKCWFPSDENESSHSVAGFIVTVVVVVVVVIVAVDFLGDKVLPSWINVVVVVVVHPQNRKSVLCAQFQTQSLLGSWTNAMQGRWMRRQHKWIFPWMALDKTWHSLLKAYKFYLHWLSEYVTFFGCLTPRKLAGVDVAVGVGDNRKFNGGRLLIEKRIQSKIKRFGCAPYERWMLGE